MLSVGLRTFVRPVPVGYLPDDHAGPQGPLRGVMSTPSSSRKSIFPSLFRRLTNLLQFFSSDEEYDEMSASTLRSNMAFALGLSSRTVSFSPAFAQGAAGPFLQRRIAELVRLRGEHP